MGRFQSGRGNNKGRGGRAPNKNNKAKSNGNATQQRKGLGDYIYTLGKSASDYEIITRYLILHIRKSYQNGDDIGNALDTMEETEFFPPTLKVSTNDDAAIKARENKEYEMMFTARLSIFLKKEEIYLTNKGKAYAFLFGQCNKVMQAKLMERRDYDSSMRDPIALLQSIKEISLSYQDNKYDMKIITTAIKAFVNLKQKDDESLVDYTNRFKSAKDVFKTHLGGEMVLHKVVMNDDEYIDDDDTDEAKENNQKLIKKHYDRWAAYLYLENSDRNKYGTLVDGLDSQLSLGNNQYPTTLVKATEVLGNHKFDPAYLEHKKKKNRNNNQGSSNNNEKQETSNETADEPQVSFATIEGTCYGCGKPGHKSPQCRHKDKLPRDQWAINKASKNENIHVQASSNGSVQVLLLLMYKREMMQQQTDGHLHKLDCN